MTTAGVPRPGDESGTTLITRVADLHPGDWITELDTPTGPWFEVLAVDGHSVVLDARATDDDPPLVVSLPYAPSAAVLRRPRRSRFTTCLGQTGR